MPTINIPAKVRFALYLIGVVGAVLVQYAIDKSWFGEAELRLWSGVAAVLFMLAAAKTTAAPSQEFKKLLDKQTVALTAVSKSAGKAVGDALNRSAGSAARRDRGAIDVGTAIVISVLAAIFTLLLLIIVNHPGVLR